MIILEKLFEENGISIFNIRDDKFKTNTINIFFADNLEKKTVAVNALMMAVLKRGTKSYPKTIDLEKKKEELYGLSFGCGISKRGESNLLSLYINVMDNKYAMDNEDISKEAFLFAKDIILNPYIVNGLFNEEYIETEKNNIINFIEGKINAKGYYALQSLIEEMCKDEPFGIYEYGQIEDYSNITNERLVKNYERMINHLPMYIFVSGNMTNEQVMEYTEGFRNMKRGEIAKLNKVNITKKDIEEKVIINEMDIVQEQYCMGFRTNIEPNSKDYAALMVYNSILGGGMTSKLFENIREKNSMCYTIYSSLVRVKGLMVIHTGIDAKNRDKVRKMIFDELDNMKNGVISETELDVAIKSILTSLESFTDTQEGVLDFNVVNVLFNFDIDIDGFKEMVSNVKLEDVVRVSQNIVLDTEYILTLKAE